MLGIDAEKNFHCHDYFWPKIQEIGNGIYSGRKKTSDFRTAAPPPAEKKLITRDDARPLTHKKRNEKESLFSFRFISYFLLRETNHLFYPIHQETHHVTGCSKNETGGVEPFLSSHPQGVKVTITIHNNKLGKKAFSLSIPLFEHGFQLFHHHSPLTIPCGDIQECQLKEKRSLTLQRSHAFQSKIWSFVLLSFRERIGSKFNDSQR